MREYIKIYKNWHKLAKPSKKICFWDFLFVVFTQVCVLVVIPIFSARLTSAISNTLINQAIIMAVIVLVLYALKNIGWHVDYVFYAPTIKHSYARISNEFIDKTLNAKKANFDKISREKILNTIHNDVFTISDFTWRMVSAEARLLMTIVSLAIIFYANLYAGIIVLVADILDFAIFALFQNKRQKYVRLMRAANDKQLEKFAEILDKRDTIIDLGQEKRVKKEYNELVNDYVKQLNKRTFWDSMKDNQYQTIYRALIFIATLICILLVSKGSMTTATYFTVVAYVTDGITAAKDMYNVLYYFNEVNVATQRVNAIMDFVEKDEVKYGTNSYKDILGSLCFSNVSYKKDDEGNPNVKSFDLLLKENETTLLLGGKNCGKRAIFNIIRRTIHPASGEVSLDGVNLYDYTPKAYRNIFSYVASQPVFFKGSIIKNLTVSEKNKKIVYQICKELDLYDYIQSLPKKFSTDIATLPYDKQYLLSIARSILTSCQILVLYDFPTTLSDKERDNIKSILQELHGTRTILIFSAKDYCSDICDKIVTIENGEIKNITYNQKADII